MTIASTNNRNDYTGSGATATYPYTFKVFAKTDLLVTKRDTSDIETPLAVDTDYTVSGVGATTGGSITLTAGNLPSGYHLTIRRVRPLTQSTDIRNQGDFYPEIHEDALDHVIMVDQQQQEEIDRSLKLPETVTGASVDLPIPEALKLFRWNAAGTALEAVSIADISAIVSAVDASLTLSGGNLKVTRPIRATIAGGTVDAITATFTPPITALTDNNLIVLVEATGANTSTTPTFAPDGLTAKTIVRIYGGNSIPLGAGDIAGANYKMLLALDITLDAWVFLNPALVPQLTTAQRDGLTAVNGMVIFNTTTARNEAYYGAAWRTLVDGNTTETIAGKILTSPVLTSPKIANTDYILDGNGVAIFQFNATASAVNRLAVANAATGSGPSFLAVGDDTNIDIIMVPKGTGVFKPGRLLGARDVTPTLGTVYQATTDLVVHARANGGGANFRFAAYTDGANPPTTIIEEAAGTGGGGWDYASVYMEVKKGDYWKIANTAGSATGVTITATPLG